MPCRYNDLPLKIVGNTTPHQKRKKTQRTISASKRASRSIKPLRIELPSSALYDDVDTIPETPNNEIEEIDYVPETPPYIMETRLPQQSVIEGSIKNSIHEPVNQPDHKSANQTITDTVLHPIKRESSLSLYDAELIARSNAWQAEIDNFVRSRCEPTIVNQSTVISDAMRCDSTIMSSLVRSESAVNDTVPESAPPSMPTDHLMHQPSPDADLTFEASLVESVRPSHNQTFDATFEASLVDWPDLDRSGTLDATARSATLDMSFRSPACDTPSRSSNSNSQFALPILTDSMARRTQPFRTLFPAMRYQLSTPQTQSQGSHSSPSFITPAKLSQLSNESTYGSPELNQSRVSMGLAAPVPCLPGHMNDDLRILHDRMVTVLNALKRSKRDKYWMTLIHYAIAALRIHARTEGLLATVDSVQMHPGCTPMVFTYVQSFDVSSVEPDEAHERLSDSSIPNTASTDGGVDALELVPVIVVTPEDSVSVVHSEQHSQPDQMSLSLPSSDQSASSLTQSINPDRDMSFIYPITMSLEIAQSA